MPIPVCIDERTGADRADEMILGGVPLPRGALRQGGWFVLADGDGRRHRLEGTPAAFWPDGSVKWLNLCGPADLAGGRRNDFLLDPAPLAADAGDPSLAVEISGTSVRIRGGVLDVDVRSDAKDLLTVSSDGRAMLEAPGLSAGMALVGPDGQDRRPCSLSLPDAAPRVVVKSAERVVVRLAGRLVNGGDETLAELLLFVEVFRRSPEVRLEPVWIYLGRPQDDLVESLTLTVHRPLDAAESFYALGNEKGTGYWDRVQPVKNEAGKGPRWPMARQVQLGSSFYRSEKRTFKRDASWLKILEGRRSQGWCYLGDGQFGLTAAMRYFWQEYPHSLSLDCDDGTITFGLVPPEAGPLDLRRYSPIAYGPAVYEFDKYSDIHGPSGLAKAHELMLRFSPAQIDLAPAPVGKMAYQTPPDEMERRDARAAARRRVAERGLFFANPCRVTVDGAYFASTRVLGRIAPAAGFSKVEGQLNRIMDYIAQERTYRGWYGLLDFGDVMTSYYADEDRWAYDDGGHAWLNTESLPDYGLWISALRKRRPDWLELAIEMSRHNRDLDTYHRGDFRGCGSRHGVNHWSDGDKEWRVGMPLVRRLHHYVTADPWTREYILDTVAAFQSFGERDARTFPTMTSAFAAIFTRWELTGDPADSRVLSGFADVLARAVRPDGRIASRIRVDLVTGNGEVTDQAPDDNPFFFHTFGGLDAAADYAELAAHAALSDALVRHARLYAGEGAAAYCAQYRLLAFAYRCTGETCFRDAIARGLEHTEFVTSPVGGPGILDEPPHLTIPGNRAKQMCHYVGDPLHLIPFGLAAMEEEPR